MDKRLSNVSSSPNLNGGNGITKMNSNNFSKIQEKEKPQTNMSFGDKYQSNSNEKQKETHNKETTDKKIQHHVTFSSNGNSNNINKNQTKTSSFDIEANNDSSFKKIKKILYESKCGIQAPGQEKPNQDNFIVTKNIFDDKKKENYFFSVW